MSIYCEGADNIKAGISEAIQLLRTKFDRPRDVHDKLYYHGTKHTLEVIDKTRQILEIYSPLPEADQQRRTLLACFAAAYHDTDQTWTPYSLESNVPIVKRFRKIGYVEQRSFEIALEFIVKTNVENDEMVFTDTDIDLIREGILTTTPSFDVDLGTVIQPLFTPDASSVAQAIALADLAVAGMDGPEKFLRDTDSLLLEDSITLLEVLIGQRLLDQELSEILREQMILWTRRQLQFAIGRKQRFQEVESTFLPNKNRTAIMSMFNKFDDTIECMINIVKAREKMTYRELLKDSKMYQLLVR